MTVKKILAWCILGPLVVVTAPLWGPAYLLVWAAFTITGESEEL